MTMLSRIAAAPALAAALLACGGGSHVDGQVVADNGKKAADAARQAADDTRLGTDKTATALDATDLVRKAFELLGLAPTYTCGEPEPAFAADVASGIRLRYPCANVSAEALTTADAIHLDLASAGCSMYGHTATGSAIFTYSGGTDRFDLAADLRQLQLDGKPLNAQVGYGTCSDETRYWALVEGPLPKHADVNVKLDAHVAKRDGLPIIGETTLIVDGTGSATGPGGTDRVTFTGLQWDIGVNLPKAGIIEVETATGHHVKAEFTEGKCTSTATVTVDDHAPVTVPVG